MDAKEQRRKTDKRAIRTDDQRRRKHEKLKKHKEAYQQNKRIEDSIKL